MVHSTHSFERYREGWNQHGQAIGKHAVEFGISAAQHKFGVSYNKTIYWRDKVVRMQFSFRNIYLFM